MTRVPRQHARVLKHGCATNTKTGVCASFPPSFSLVRAQAVLYQFPLFCFIMPTLGEISYSREATIAAFRDYYEFLKDMFLPDDWILEPPAVGWPSITKQKARLLGKNDDVFELMRHLPYLPDSSFLVARSTGANWSSVFEKRKFSHEGVKGTRILTEALDWLDVALSAFGLARGGGDTCMIILDTRFGTVHWLESPDLDFDAIRQPIVGPDGDEEPFRDCAPPNERGWRSHTAWAITDSFEVLKHEFRTLRSVPLNGSQVEYWLGDEEYQDLEELDEEKILIRSVRDTYQKHGWPDMSIYNKDECQDFVDKLMKESGQYS